MDPPGNGSGNGKGASAQVEQNPLAHPTLAAPAAIEGDRVRQAFALGGSLAELKGRILTAFVGPPGSQIQHSGKQEEPLLQLETQIGKAFWLASMWRLHFNRASALQQTLFPNGTDEGTSYDPGKGPLYLYPNPDSPAGDYADRGIPRSDGTPEILSRFALCEATRRSINCLILLYLRPEYSLIPDVLREQQRALVGAIASSMGHEVPGALTEDVIHQGIATLTDQTMRLLNWWDNFLREKFNSAGLALEDETRLIAYEAGRAMATLSWNLTVQAAPLEDSDAADLEGRTKNLTMLWQSAFSARDIAYLQHQIAALAKGFDAAFSDSNAPARTNGSASLEVNPGLPSQSLQTVSRSIEYWRRSVEWLGAPPTTSTVAVTLTPNLWKGLRLRLVEQVNIWQALLQGQEDLQSYTAQNVIQAFLADVIATFEVVAQEEGLAKVEQMARQQVTSVVRTLWPVFAIVVAVGILGALAVLVLGHVQPSELTGSAVGVLVALVGGLGLFQANKAQSTATSSASRSSSAGIEADVKNQVNNLKDKAGALVQGNGLQSSSLVDRVTGLFGKGADEALLAFERGYQQIQIDLASLGFSVGVSYPLIEFFIVNTKFVIKCNYDFLTQIIWDQTDRKEEVLRVAYAAFGPIGWFALVRSQGDKTPTPSTGEGSGKSW